MLSHIERLLLDYTDEREHIVQKDRDGGDSLNRIGAFYSCIAADYFDFTFSYHAAMAENERDGRYCRNPEPGRWYSNYDNTTRDQMINLEAAWALLGDTNRARRHFGQRIKRCMFHFSSQNDGYDSGLPLTHKFPDAPTPVELATIIRAGKYWALRPLLYILDWFLVLDCAIVRRLNARNLYDTDNNLLPAVLAALEIYPTFIGKIAKWFYAKSDAETRLLDYHAEGGVYDVNGTLIDVKNGIAPLGAIMARTFRKKIQCVSE